MLAGTSPIAIAARGGATSIPANAITDETGTPITDETGVIITAG